MNLRGENKRHLGLLGATGLGVGAIVGGGILALAGVAFATTGPGAIVAFAVNGFIALLTALSFAEMSSKFCESGGTYTFAKKVLSVEAGFVVGWVVWFASVVAAVLYALGFAHFGLAIVADLAEAFRGQVPPWFNSPRAVTAAAAAITVVLAVGLMLKAGGGGQWVNVVKVIVFAILIMGGFWALTKEAPADVGARMRPFFSAGATGLLQAMGYTFIALQGFDLIAAAGGEVRDPSRNIPRAMLLSLGIALLIYLPLLLVIATVGVSEGQAIQSAAADDPEEIVAIAAENFLGQFGYWLVMIAAVLSMYSALQANLFAASRIAQTMASDRTLPAPLRSLHATRRTPAVAVAVTAVIVLVILLAIPNVAAAGAAASLIFLVTFALAHWLSILVRLRSANRPPPFRAPLFPAVPIVGGFACVGLAVFQGIAVPIAGQIAVVWLALGGILFLALLARRARIMDASSTALDPELLTLRGSTPLVLVPIANPQNAEALVTLANALVPSGVGRVLMLTVVVANHQWHPDEDPEPTERAQLVLHELLRVSARVGIQAKILTTVAPNPMEEIARVVRLHRCESVLLGLSEISTDTEGTPLERLFATVDADIAVLRTRDDWKLEEATRILVPVAGRGNHEHLLVRLLGSLHRTAVRHVTFLRVLPEKSGPRVVRRASRELQYLTDSISGSTAEVVQHNDVLSTVAEKAEDYDLLVLGLQRHGRCKKLFGEFTRRIAQRTSCPLVVISHGK
jgi:APA family basic amino acid/polyamine antiporter